MVSVAATLLQEVGSADLKQVLNAILYSGTVSFASRRMLSATELQHADLEELEVSRCLEEIDILSQVFKAALDAGEKSEAMMFILSICQENGGPQECVQILSLSLQSQAENLRELIVGICDLLGMFAQHAIFITDSASMIQIATLAQRIEKMYGASYPSIASLGVVFAVHRQELLGLPLPDLISAALCWGMVGIISELPQETAFDILCSHAHLLSQLVLCFRTTTPTDILILRETYLNFLENQSFWTLVRENISKKTGATALALVATEALGFFLDEELPTSQRSLYQVIDEEWPEENRGMWLCASTNVIAHMISTETLLPACLPNSEELKELFSDVASQLTKKKSASNLALFRAFTLLLQVFSSKNLKFIDVDKLFSTSVAFSCQTVLNSAKVLAVEARDVILLERICHLFNAIGDRRLLKSGILNNQFLRDLCSHGSWDMVSWFFGWVLDTIPQIEIADFCCPLFTCGAFCGAVVGVQWIQLAAKVLNENTTLVSQIPSPIIRSVMDKSIEIFVYVMRMSDHGRRRMHSLVFSELVKSWLIVIDALIATNSSLALPLLTKGIDSLQGQSPIFILCNLLFLTRNQEVVISLATFLRRLFELGQQVIGQIAATESAKQDFGDNIVVGDKAGQRWLVLEVMLKNHPNFFFYFVTPSTLDKLAQVLWETISNRSSIKEAIEALKLYTLLAAGKVIANCSPFVARESATPQNLVDEILFTSAALNYNILLKVDKSSIENLLNTLVTQVNLFLQQFNEEEDQADEITFLTTICYAACSLEANFLSLERVSSEMVCLTLRLCKTLVALFSQKCQSPLFPRAVLASLRTCTAAARHFKPSVVFNDTKYLFAIATLFPCEQTIAQSFLALGYLARCVSGEVGKGALLCVAETLEHFTQSQTLTESIFLLVSNFRHHLTPFLAMRLIWVICQRCLQLANSLSWNVTVSEVREEFNRYLLLLQIIVHQIPEASRHVPPDTMWKICQVPQELALAVVQNQQAAWHACWCRTLSLVALLVRKGKQQWCHFAIDLMNSSSRIQSVLQRIVPDEKDSKLFRPLLEEALGCCEIVSACFSTGNCLNDFVPALKQGLSKLIETEDDQLAADLRWVMFCQISQVLASLPGHMFFETDFDLERVLSTILLLGEKVKASNGCLLKLALKHSIDIYIKAISQAHRETRDKLRKREVTIHIKISG